MICSFFPSYTLILSRCTSSSGDLGSGLVYFKNNPCFIQRVEIFFSLSSTPPAFSSGFERSIFSHLLSGLPLRGLEQFLQLLPFIYRIIFLVFFFFFFRALRHRPQVSNFNIIAYLLIYQMAELLAILLLASCRKLLDKCGVHEIFKNKLRHNFLNNFFFFFNKVIQILKAVIKFYIEHYLLRDFQLNCNFSLVRIFVVVLSTT
jgi:hypothetical protein